MAEYEFIDNVVADGTTSGYGWINKQFLTVGLKVRFINGKPIYKVKIDEDTELLVSKQEGKKYNAKFRYKDNIYGLDVPFWE